MYFLKMFTTIISAICLGLSVATVILCVVSAVIMLWQAALETPPIMPGMLLLALSASGLLGIGVFGITTNLLIESLD